MGLSQGTLLVPWIKIDNTDGVTDGMTAWQVGDKAGYELENEPEVTNFLATAVHDLVVGLSRGTLLVSRIKIN